MTAHNPHPYDFHNVETCSESEREEIFRGLLTQMLDVIGPYFEQIDSLNLPNNNELFYGVQTMLYIASAILRAHMRLSSNPRTLRRHVLVKLHQELSEELAELEAAQPSPSPTKPTVH